MLLLLLACRTAEVIDACAADPELCPTCTSSAECEYTGNPCNDTVFCAHRAAPVSVTAIGCDAALEYSWPDDATCQCVASVCEYVE